MTAMKPHIDAIRAQLTGAGLLSYFVDVPTPTPPATQTYPYQLVWSSSGIPPVESPIAGPLDLTDTIGVTTVAQSPEGVLIAQANARAALNGSHPVVAGQVTWLVLEDSLPVQADRAVTPHVYFGVDTYRLISTPA